MFLPLLALNNAFNLSVRLKFISSPTNLLSASKLNALFVEYPPTHKEHSLKCGGNEIRIFLVHALISHSHQSSRTTIFRVSVLQIHIALSHELPPG